MSTFIDQLRIGEVRDIKLGKSFRRGKSLDATNRNLNIVNGDNDSFHTIRYDFKPASVDLNKVSTIEIDSNKATIIAPNVDGSGFPHTVYKGSCKPHGKECVLIIDNDTGEITLERLSQNIVVKKTRAEGTSKLKLPPQRPITPSLETVNGVNKKFSPPSNMLSSQQTFPSSYSSTTSQQQQQQQQNKTSPKCNENNFKSAITNSESQLANNKRIESSSGIINNNICNKNNNNNNDDEMIGTLSDSSNESSDNESSSSDSSSESGSDSSDEDDAGNHIRNAFNNNNNNNGQMKSADTLNMPLLSAGQLVPQNMSSIKPTQQNDFSSSDSNLDSSDDDDDDHDEHHRADDHINVNVNMGMSQAYNSRDRQMTGAAFQSMPNILATQQQPQLSQTSNQPPPPPPAATLQQQNTAMVPKSNQFNMPSGLNFNSMPKFSQLSQDLQLSESGSDSE